jgi:quercetin dioxygenase-like cupin family protein
MCEDNRSSPGRRLFLARLAGLTTGATILLGGVGIAEGAQKSVILPGSKNATVTIVYEHAIPGIAGKAIKGALVEYGPGGFSPSHTHAKSAIIYATVIEGEVRSQLNDGPVQTYRTGQNWTELPGDHHRVSANASESRPAKILAVFVVDNEHTELTIPDRD